MNGIEQYLSAWELQEIALLDTLKNANSQIRIEFIKSNIAEIRRDFISQLLLTESSECCDIIMKQYSIK